MGNFQLPPSGSPATGAGTPTVDELAVHDVNISRQPRFSPGGGITQDYVVRFFVGAHGPFVHEYDPSSYSPAQVEQDIQAEVSSIAAVTRSYTRAASSFAMPSRTAFRVRQISHSGTDVGPAPSLQSVVSWFQQRNQGFQYVPFNQTVALRPGQWSVVQYDQIGLPTTYGVEWATWSGDPGFDLTPPPGGNYPG